jgi:hypothetical protein
VAGAVDIAGADVALRTAVARAGVTVAGAVDIATADVALRTAVAAAAVLGAAAETRALGKAAAVAGLGVGERPGGSRPQARTRINRKGSNRRITLILACRILEIRH